MDELEKLRQSLRQERPVSWEEFPDLTLYMDQVISYMPRQLIQVREGEGLTSAMVNNYIKDGLLPRAEGKRYHAVHLAYLTAICAMKRVLSVRDIKNLMDACNPSQDPRASYEGFCRVLDRALLDTAACTEREVESREELAELALTLALRSYADQLACTRILDLVCPPEEPEGKHKK